MWQQYIFINSRQRVTTLKMFKCICFNIMCFSCEFIDFYFRPGNAGVHRFCLPSGDIIFNTLDLCHLCIRKDTNIILMTIVSISYLHSCDPPIIHGNLTCDTIFIQHNGLIKIGSGMLFHAHLVLVKSFSRIDFGLNWCLLVILFKMLTFLIKYSLIKSHAEMKPRCKVCINASFCLSL